jgi:hypothetical protein
MPAPHEAVFVDLLQKSRQLHSQFERAARVDDVLLGAVISAGVRLGKCLIDLQSDGSSHFVRFEELASRTRLTFRLTHLTSELAAAKALGHLANVTVGLGRPVNRVATLWPALKQDVKSGFITAEEPGVISLDADMASGYVYAQVPLLWRLEEYLRGADHDQPDHEKVASHIYCCELALGKYLDGRLDLAGGESHVAAGDRQQVQAQG